MNPRIFLSRFRTHARAVFITKRRKWRAAVEQRARATPVAGLREARPRDRRSRLRRADSENYGPE